MRRPGREALWIATLLLACGAETARQDAPSCGDCNLVLVSLDTLRADHLGVYGYARDTSPELDAFAARSLRFANAFSTARKTAPSHASMFTSLHPTVHGVFMNDATPEGQGAQYRLDARVPTLPQLLSDAGFATVAWHGGGNVSASYGFARGFARYDGFASYRKRGSVAREVFRANEWRPAFHWLEQHGDERFFLFLHTYAIHDPYQPPEPYYSLFASEYRGRIRPVPNDKRAAERYWANVDREDARDVAHLVDLYDGGIRYADAHLVGPLLRRLESLGLLESSIVVVLSDHGEEFMEHGSIRHEQLYDEILRVPLIVYLPPRATRGRELAGTRDARVSLLDLAPTLLELLEVPHDAAAFQGRSLVPLIAGQESQDRAIYAEALMAKWGPEALRGEDRLQTVLRSGEYKIYRRELKSGDLFELFRASDDPGEHSNLATQEPDALADMQARLSEVGRANRAFRTERGYEADARAYDEALVDELRALGYIDGGEE